MSKVVGRFWPRILSALFVSMLACPAVAQDKKEITFGYSISLTGKFSTDATDTHKAYQMWAEDTNKAGGITVKDRKLPIKLVHYDDASDTNTAIRNYERLVTRDEVNFLLSPWGSGHNFAVTAATEKYRYPMVLSSRLPTRISCSRRACMTFWSRSCRASASRWSSTSNILWAGRTSPVC